MKSILTLRYCKPRLLCSLAKEISVAVLHHLHFLPFSGLEWL